MPHGGCYAPEPVEWIDGVTDVTCPAGHLPKYAEAFRAWRWMQRGHLPAAGGWADQSPVWIVAMEIIAAVESEAQARVATQ